MRSLDRKVINDLWAIKGQVFAIGLVIGAGVATFVMALSTLKSLAATKDAYYERYRFADVFAHVKRAPESVVARLATIPGVAQIQTRIVMDVILDVPGVEEPALGRLISITPSGTQSLNRIHLRRGRPITPGRPNEIVISEAFAAANRLEPGDTVRAIINGRYEVLRIVGVALSPEYIIQLAGGNLLPNDLLFAVIWMDREQLEAAFDLKGAFNDLSMTLMHSGSESAVIDQLDQQLARYGGTGAIGRYEQVSHHYITEEIKQLRTVGFVTPIIFLAVAAFLQNIVLSRIVSSQREIIGLLRAFGYSRFEIILHYSKMMGVITLLGLGLGLIAGWWMGWNLTQLYSQFYRFPMFTYEMDPQVLIAVVVIALIAMVSGTITSLQRAANLPPAEAMRPEPARKYSRTLVERVGLGTWFSPGTRMILRQFERYPIKTGFSCFGIAIAVAVLVLGSFGKDAIEYVLSFQFSLSQRFDVSVTLVEPTEGDCIYEFRNLPGVLAVEPFRAVPVRLRNGHYDRRVGITGINPGSELYRLFNTREQAVLIPPEGLLLSRKLAEILNVEPGDQIRMDLLEGQRHSFDVEISDTIEDFGGLNAYMDLRAVQRLIGEEETISGAFLKVDELTVSQLYQDLKKTARVAGVSIKSADLESFKRTIAENILMMQVFNVGFAVILAVGVVYNNARISLAERSREFATLRVMGYTRTELSRLLLGEFAILTCFAIPLGLSLGRLFSWMTSLGLDTEVFRIPLIIERSTYGLACLIVVAAVSASGWAVSRRMSRLDLVAVLKSKE